MAAAAGASVNKALPDTPTVQSWLAAAAERSVEVLHPGFVIIRNAITESAQLELAALALERGDSPGPDGWWVTPEEVASNPKAGSWDKRQRGGPTVDHDDATRRILNVARKRAGKVYDAIETFPGGDRLERFALELLAVAAAVDHHLAEVPTAPPTHLLLWNYRPSKGQRIGWHRDNWRGDGDADHPVISLSLGASCNFGWRPEPALLAPLRPGAALTGGPSASSVPPCPPCCSVLLAAAGEKNRSVVLESGDVVVFGGVSRMMEHAVKSIHSAASAPVALQAPHSLAGGRLNFTFRHAPAVEGVDDVHKGR